MEPTTTKKARRGFAAMSPEKQREIASLGGRASHAGGKGHEWSQEAAREAARKAVALRVAKRAEREAAEKETPANTATTVAA